MRRVLIVLCAVVALAAGGVAAYDAVGGGPSSGRGSSRGGESAAATLPHRPPVLAGHAAPSTAPDPAAVAAALRSPARARGLGRLLVGEAVDFDTGRLLWKRDPETAVRPASNAKLLTAAAALTALGPDARLTTRTVRSRRTVWLVGGGDVTLASTAPPRGRSAGYPSPATLPDLAAATARALRAAGAHRVRLRYDTTAESGRRIAPGWKSSYLTEGDVATPSSLEVDEGRIAPDALARVSDPAAVAASDFAHDLAERGIHVVGSPREEAAPSDAAGLAEVRSPTVAALVQQMLTASDNDLAEALARAVARAAGSPATFADGARSVLSVDRGLGLPMTGVRLVDGSGLSRDDRVPPQTLLAVLRMVASGAHPKLAAIGEGLPVAGFSGTLGGRFDAPGKVAAAAGEVRAKTGTLDGVSALSGYAVDRSGDLLGFSFIAARTKSADLAEPALDRLAATLAGCGCRAIQRR